MADLTVIVGGGIEDDSAALLDAWRRAKHGETVNERVLALESREVLGRVLTGERCRVGAGVGCEAAC